MSDPNNPRLREILAQAAALPIEQRPALLDQSCANDPELRQHVESLLTALDHGSDFLENPTLPLNPNDPPHPLREGPGSRISHYKLLQQIGEGGMGIVFMAEQESPVRCRVALKIIKPGMDSRQVVARFEAERQALAVMDHPNIAHVYDAGATDTGRPYFVMELVRGTPITEYCDKHELTTRERLELLVQVCQAVQHAHSKGIIHRDLKPSNVLVTVSDGQPVPKVIDFGVAKATQSRLTEKTLFTEFRQLMGTPQYMSPEQADHDGVDVDTRSDVYSLGVLLYELLTGTTPLDGKELRSKAYAEMERIIRETDPPKPSARLSTLGASATAIASRRKTEPKKLNQLLRGELDWIVLRALEKDRSRRYETANGLARDIQRYLADEPVEACPPSATYRMHRFVRRNRTSLSVAAGFAVVLLASALISSWQAIRLARLHAAQVEQLKQEEAVASTLESIFQRMNLSYEIGPPDPNVQMLLQLDDAASKVATNYENAPVRRARLRDALGDAALALGQPQKAEALFRAALEDQRSHLAPNDPQTLVTLHGLARAYLGNGRIADATKLLIQVRDERIRVKGKEDVITLRTLRDLASAYHDDGRYQDAVALLEEVQGVQLRTLGPDDRDTLSTQSDLADGYRHLFRLNEAVSLLEKVRVRQKARLGEDHPGTLQSLARAYIDAHRFRDAIALLEPLCDRHTAKLGADHPDSLIFRGTLASAYRCAGRFVESVEILEQVCTRLSARLGNDHPLNLSNRYELAWSYHDAGRFQEMASTLEAIRGPQIKLFGENGRLTLRTQAGLADAYRHLGRLGDSLKLFELVRLRQTEHFGPDDPDTLSTIHNLAWAYSDDGRPQDAISLLERVRDIRAQKFELDDPGTLFVLTSLGKLYHSAGRNAEALKMLEHARDKLVEKLGMDHPDTMNALDGLAATYGAVGRYSDAIAIGEALCVHTNRTSGPDSNKALVRGNDLALLYDSAGRSDDAIKLFEDVRARELRSLGPEHINTAITLNNLAYAYWKVGRYDEVIAGLKQVRDWQISHLGAEARETLRTRTNLGEVYFNNQQIDEALEVLEQLRAPMLEKKLGHPKDVKRTRDVLINVYRAAGRREEAAKLFGAFRAELEDSIKQKTVALTTRPSDPLLLFDRGTLLTRVGELDKAESDFTKAIEIFPGNHRFWHDGLMPLLLHRGDFDGYRQRLGRELELFKNSSDGVEAHRVSKDALALPVDATSRQIGIELANRSKIEETRGMAAYRAGDYRLAINWLQKTSKADGIPRWALARLFMAMSYERLGEYTLADEMLAGADKAMETQFPHPGEGDYEAFTDYILCDVVRKEAAELIHQRPPATRPSASTQPIVLK